ncbi:MAG: outer membrane protein assembly factor BamE [Comamonadaceae bacterium]|nr:MAG: outer membrane protein assembly factor BamE [Comamonadaceae bacterium]
MKTSVRTLIASATLFLAACAGTAFDWENARKLQLGMTEKEVTDLMGAPYSVRSVNDGTQTWVWSFANGMTGSSRVVSAVFRDGKVITVPSVPASFR